jgi:hypothetical protein
MRLRRLNDALVASVFVATVAAWLAGAGCGLLTGEMKSQSRIEGRRPVTVTRTNYHGWPNSIVMRNAGAEVVIVPAIGRIMQFQCDGEPGPFWENRSLDGQVHPPRATNWINFGGDKTWPAPEAEWPKPYGGWIPPAAFDSMPLEARIERDQVVLSSPVDPEYGIRVVRRVFLGPRVDQMTISTRYEKVSGEPKKVGVWTITQLQEPAGLFAPAPGPTGFEAGFQSLGKEPPPSLKVVDTARPPLRLVSLTRNHTSAHKIGLACGSLLWVGEKQMLKIDLPRLRNADYPDGGSSAEIYTNPDPLRYIELEMLSPLATMKRGAVMEWANIYTLLPRSRRSPEAEARAIYER